MPAMTLVTMMTHFRAVLFHFTMHQYAINWLLNLVRRRATHMQTNGFSEGAF